MLMALTQCECGVFLSLAVMCVMGTDAGTRAVYKLTLLSCKRELHPTLTPRHLHNEGPIRGCA